MSAKLLHALTDDNPDLQKQIGCMTGIFQLFDRHHIVTAKRIASHQTSRKITSSGSTRLSDGNLGGEAHNARNIHIDKERNLGKNANENHRVSTESSRASFSSSCSSSFSSVECNKPAQPELLSFDRTITQEITSKELHAYQSNASAQLGRQSPDFRDVVRDSMYREARGLSVKTGPKEEQASRTMKHRDSPRPMQMSKSVNESLELGINTRQNLKDSLKVLAKLREAPRYFNDPRESPKSSYETRDGTSLSLPKDAPRFSYDGREIPRSSFESRDNFKSTTRLRDLPRLSLDSRESSIKDSNLIAKSNFVKDFHGSRDDFTRTFSKQQEMENHNRNPSVVAKLMGLEAMPNSIIAKESPMGSSSEKTDERIQSATACSPRQSIKETVSPRLRKPDPVVKPIPSSRVPIEPAPWRQLGSSHGFQKSTSKSSDFSPRAMNTSPSVYAEIEKRLKDLEFKQADKDLRALKQILDAMQAKVLLESRKEDDKASLSEDYSEDHNTTTVDRNSRLSNRQSPSHTSPISPNLKRTSVSKTFDSPIVIMKPAKLIEKSGIPASSVIRIEDLSGLRKLRNVDLVDSKKVYANNHTATDVTTRLGLGIPSSSSHGSTIDKVNSRALKSTTSSKSSQLPRQNTGNSARGMTTGSMNSRQQQKKLEVEKRAKPPLHTLDLSKPRRQSAKQPAESGSPGGKRRHKSLNLPQSDDQLSEISGETRISSHLGDEISPHMDVEIISTDGSADMSCAFFQQGGRSPSRKFTGSTTSSSTQTKMSAMQNEDVSETESTSIAPEQPSPVSVLDASFYKDDLPSPDGKEAFKVETQKSNEPSAAAGWDAVDINHSSGVSGPNQSIEIGRKKLENVGNLVQKLQRLNSNHDEATTDYIASLCENTNPDHRYISEILLASGLLLRDLGSGLTSIQLHASGHPINPDLFFVLEQTKVKTALSSKDNQLQKNAVRLKFDREKVHRKLVFDAVNEILERKFATMALASELWLRTDKLAGRTSNAQQLLKELCSEIEKLQAYETSDGCSVDCESLNTIVFKDVVCEPEKWTGFPREISGIVLDVERSIFKELVDEVVSGEAMSFRAKPRRRGRQLFTK
ncbi:hypothetical protein Scep_016455 [Stephania cephalantha]|uniref:Protein LONGIFOLIA 1 n=1 Tax=Stephania cephalantha TaxID=152367 RepID=A0AAP0IMV6_9MAGN